MLLSTDVINTSVSILNCPILKDSSGDEHLVQIYIMSYVYACYYRDGIMMVQSSASQEHIFH